MNIFQNGFSDQNKSSLDQKKKNQHKPSDQVLILWVMRDLAVPSYEYEGISSKSMLSQEILGFLKMI